MRQKEGLFLERLMQKSIKSINELLSATPREDWRFFSLEKLNQREYRLEDNQQSWGRRCMP